MRTFEMVALADESGKTYKTGDMLYNNRNGFHDNCKREWNYDAFQEEGLNFFVHLDGWAEVVEKEMKLEELIRYVEDKMKCKIRVVA